MVPNQFKTLIRLLFNKEYNPLWINYDDFSSSPKPLKTKKTLFLPNFLRRRQIFEKKTGQKPFLENFDKKKFRFFLARAPPQSYYI